MTGREALLDVRDLTVGFPDQARDGHIAVSGVSFDLARGEILGIVGESGSGKSMTLRAILGLLPDTGVVLGGEAWLGGTDLLASDEAALRRVRGTSIAMIFQDPASSLNPVLSVGTQLTELLRVKRRLSRRASRVAASELLHKVELPDPPRIMRQYPHQLSGGMRQRVMIAMALAESPSILFADEPTTALDVTIQDQIIALLEQLRDDLRMAIVLVSHDLGVISQMCDTIGVMYGGHLVEVGAAEAVLDCPRHPYTSELLGASDLGPAGRTREYPGSASITLPSSALTDSRCCFVHRCPFAEPGCGDIDAAFDAASPAHRTTCVRANALEGTLCCTPEVSASA